MVFVPSAESRSGFMSEEPIPRRLTVNTTSGGELAVTCPLCSHGLFISVRAQSAKPGVGFQHLLLGQEVHEGKLGDVVALPVRFHACANCGHILKFLMPRP